jgi:hypothetical protein
VRRAYAKKIKAARLDGFGGRCMGVAVAINRVLFGGKGEYWVATNEHVDDITGGFFVGHVAVKHDGKFFDASGEVSRDMLESFGQVEPDEDAWPGLSEEDGLDAALVKVTEKDVLSFEPDGAIRTKLVLKEATEALRSLKKNPYAPGINEILERPFPLDSGFWSFEVGRDTDDEQKFGYLAPPGVTLKALPGELVVTVPYKAPKEREDGDVVADFTGAMAVFTPEPISADKVIEFGLYPDFHALPHFLLEIIGDTDHVELVHVGDKYREGDVALIHRDTYPEHGRAYRGKVREYRITFFDKHGPSGHHNGDFDELVAEAVHNGYRRLAPGALDAIFKEMP